MIDHLICVAIAIATVIYVERRRHDRWYEEGARMRRWLMYMRAKREKQP